MIMETNYIPMLTSWQYFRLKYNHISYLPKRNIPDYPYEAYNYSNLCAGTHDFITCLN